MQNLGIASQDLLGPASVREGTGSGGTSAACGWRNVDCTNLPQHLVDLNLLWFPTSSCSVVECCRVIQPIRALSKIRLDLSVRQPLVGLPFGCPRKKHKKTQASSLQPYSALKIIRSILIAAFAHGGIHMWLILLGYICTTNSCGSGAMRAQRTCLPKDCPCLFLCHGLSRSIWSEQLKKPSSAVSKTSISHNHAELSILILPQQLDRQGKSKVLSRNPFESAKVQTKSNILQDIERHLRSCTAKCADSASQDWVGRVSWWRLVSQLSTNQYCPAQVLFPSARKLFLHPRESDDTIEAENKQTNKHEFAI